MKMAIELEGHAWFSWETLRFAVVIRCLEAVEKLDVDIVFQQFPRRSRWLAVSFDASSLLTLAQQEIALRRQLISSSSLASSIPWISIAETSKEDLTIE
ncbi:hypothetical protein ARMSODRAFT_1019920 [Armillaria solidipes]|uniref:Uncharacterized protein n=1 Tax=Armillaria solidipes TaxID=1076256 RepID=A0A2H3BBW0_9AGAR|nr:hypothetical protein ARMSODRAFT_1019920 [Armillaria solidipes]